MNEAIEGAIKRAALLLLPGGLVYRLWHLRRRGRLRTEDGTATDLRSFPVQPGLRLDVYWSDVALGSGPSASLWAHGEEVLRLDCLPGRAAHMHLNPVQLNLALPWSVTPRIAFPPASIEDQIERAAFELENNAVTALQMNQLARIRAFAIEPGSLARAAAEMRAYMRELLARRGGGRVDASGS